MRDVGRVMEEVERKGKIKASPKGDDYAAPTGIVARNLYVRVGAVYRMSGEIDSSNDRVGEGSPRGGLEAGLVGRFTMERIERVPSEDRTRAEHLHTRISMRRTHEKIIDCLRTRPCRYLPP